MPEKVTEGIPNELSKKKGEEISSSIAEIIAESITDCYTARFQNGKASEWQREIFGQNGEKKFPKYVTKSPENFQRNFQRVSKEILIGEDDFPEKLHNMLQKIFKGIAETIYSDFT